MNKNKIKILFGILVFLLIIILLINLPILFLKDQNSKATFKIVKISHDKFLHPLKKIKNLGIVPWSLEEKKKSSCHFERNLIKIS